MDTLKNVWRAVLEGYGTEKRQWDRIFPWNAFVLRPVSLVLTVPLAGFGVTANQVTGLTALLGLMACVLFVQGTFQGLLFGGVCVTVMAVFDCVDGNLARIGARRGPPTGKFYDHLVGHFYPLTYFFLGAGLGRAYPERQIEMLLAGAVATICRLMVLHVRHEFSSVLAGAWADARSSRGREGSAALRRWAVRAYHNVTDLQGHEFLLWMGALGGWLPLFLVVSAAVAILDLLFTVGLHVARAVRL